MPDELWAAAAALAETSRPYFVAQSLRVDYGALKARMVEAKRSTAPEAPAVADFVEVGDAVPVVGDIPRMAEAERAAVADFVEVKAAPVAVDVHPAVYEMELSGADGAGLVVRFAEGSTVDVAGLATAFWSRGV